MVPDNADDVKCGLHVIRNHEILWRALPCPAQLCHAAYIPACNELVSPGQRISSCMASTVRPAPVLLFGQLQIPRPVVFITAVVNATNAATVSMIVVLSHR